MWRTAFYIKTWKEERGTAYGSAGCSQGHRGNPLHPTSHQTTLQSPTMRYTCSLCAFAPAVVLPLQQTTAFSLKSSPNITSSRKSSPILQPLLPELFTPFFFVLLQYPVHTCINASIIHAMISCYLSVSLLNS